MSFIVENLSLHLEQVQQPVVWAGNRIRWQVVYCGELIPLTLIRVSGPLLEFPVLAIQPLFQFLHVAAAVPAVVAPIRVEVYRAGPTRAIFRFVLIVSGERQVPGARLRDVRERAW